MKKSDMTPEQVKAWILNRCHEDGDCLLWDGAVARGAGPAVTDPHTGRTSPTRRVLMRAMGFDVNGRVATTTCGNPLCMSEEHLVALTRKQLQQRTGPTISANVVRSAKLAASRRARSYITMELVREIRSSGMRATDAAARWDIPLQTAARILRHDTWRESVGNHFAGLGAR